MNDDFFFISFVSLLEQIFPFFHNLAYSFFFPEIVIFMINW